MRLQKKKQGIEIRISNLFSKLIGKLQTLSSKQDIRDMNEILKPISIFQKKKSRIPKIKKKVQKIDQKKV